MRISQARATESPRPRRGSPHHGDGGLGHLVEETRDFHARAERLGLVLQAGVITLASLGHGLHVATGTEATAGASDHDHADLGVIGQAGQGFEEGIQHVPRHGIEPVRAIEREDGHTVLDGFDQVLVIAAPPTAGGVRCRVPR